MCGCFRFTHRTDRPLARTAYQFKMEWYRRLTNFLRRERRRVSIGPWSAVISTSRLTMPMCTIPRSGAERSCARKTNGPLFARWKQSGSADTLRLHHPEPGIFSWWDYRMLAFPKNRGLRIDAILPGSELAAKCTDGGVDREMRKGKEPSDHAPVWAEFVFSVDVPSRCCLVIQNVLS